MPYCVKKGCFAVVNVSHDSDNGRTLGIVLKSVAFRFKAGKQNFLRSLFLLQFQRHVEIACNVFGIFKFNRIVYGFYYSFLEQLLDYLRHGYADFFAQNLNRHILGVDNRMVNHFDYRLEFDFLLLRSCATGKHSLVVLVQTGVVGTHKQLLFACGISLVFGFFRRFILVSEIFACRTHNGRQRCKADSRSARQRRRRGSAAGALTAASRRSVRRSRSLSGALRGCSLIFVAEALGGVAASRLAD